jgi:hypothetical protein
VRILLIVAQVSRATWKLFPAEREQNSGVIVGRPDGRLLQ